jgi:hypothetical protein
MFVKDKIFLTKSSFGIAPNCAVLWGSAILGLMEVMGDDFLDQSIENFNFKLVSEIIKQRPSQLLGFAFPRYFFELPEQETSLEIWLVSSFIANHAFSSLTYILLNKKFFN